MNFMTRSDAVGIIQTLLTPAIMISACGLILLGLLNRYGRINDRLRKLNRERIDLLPQKGNSLTDLQLHCIDEQLPELLKRNGLLQNAVFALFLGTLCFIATIFCIATSFVDLSAFVVRAAVAIFLLGQALVFTGLVLMAFEIRISHTAVTYETEQIMKLG